MPAHPDPGPDDARERERQRAAQRAQWNAAAGAWARWTPVFDGGARPLGRRMLELARVGEGDRVLDLATGAGEPALSAARRAPRGLVIATDVAAPMLAVARERSRAAGLANVAFLQCGGEAPPRADASVDVVLLRFGLMLFADLPRALRELARVLRPGGRLVAAVWSTERRVPLIGIPLRVARRAIGLPPPPPDAPGALRLGRPGRLVEELERAGLREVRGERAVATFAFASAGEFVRFHRELSGAVRQALDLRSPAVRERAWAEVAREVSAHAGPDGRIRLANEVHVAVGVR